MTVPKANKPNDTYIVSTGSYSVNLGKVDFSLTKDKKAIDKIDMSLINYKNINVEADIKVQELYKEVNEQYEKEKKHRSLYITRKRF